MANQGSSLLKSKTVRIYLVAIAVVVVSGLVGGITFAVTGNREPTVDRLAIERLAVVRSASSAMSAVPAVVPEPEPEIEETPSTVKSAAHFEVGCRDAGSIPAQSGDVFDCKVTSKTGFSAPVALRCVNPPKGLSCVADPATVTPPPDGSVGFHLSLSNDSVSSGRHSFKVSGTSGALTHSFNFPFNFAAAGGGSSGAPTVVPTCPFLPGNTVPRGHTVSVRCQVVAVPSFTGTLAISCHAAPAGTCTVSPTSVDLAGGVPVGVSFSLTAFPDAPLGSVPVGIQVTDPSGRVGVGGGSFPVSVIHSTDYSATCQPAASVPVGGTAQMTCEVRTGNYTGSLEIGFGAMAETGSPAASASTTTLQMGPNSRTMVTLSFNAAGAAPGSYQYFFLLKQPGLPMDGKLPDFHYPTLQVVETAPAV